MTNQSIEAVRRQYSLAHLKPQGLSVVSGVDNELPLTTRSSCPFGSCVLDRRGTQITVFRSQISQSVILILASANKVSSKKEVTNLCTVLVFTVDMANSCALYM